MIRQGSDSRGSALVRISLDASNCGRATVIEKRQVQAESKGDGAEGARQRRRAAAPRARRLARSIGSTMRRFARRPPDRWRAEVVQPRHGDAAAAGRTGPRCRCSEGGSRRIRNRARPRRAQTVYKGNLRREARPGRSHNQGVRDEGFEAASTSGSPFTARYYTSAEAVAAEDD